MSVYCFDLVPKRSSFWNQERDAHLRAFYNDQVRVDPSILALKLRTSEVQVLHRLSKLGLRNKRGVGNVQARYVVAS
jgi:hypothetical protein